MIPELFSRKYEIQATYDLLDRPEATPDAIQRGHRRLVMGELRTPGRYLLIEDTTFPSFTHRKQAVPGLGPIGGSRRAAGIPSPLGPGRPGSSGGPNATGRRPVTILGWSTSDVITPPA
jgi:hypothetical protein